MPEKNSPSKEKPTGSVKKQNDPDNVTSNTNLAPNKDDKKSPKPGKPKKDDKKSAKPGETKKDDKKSSKPPDPVVHSIQSKNILPQDPKKSGTNKPDPITRPVGASDVVANIPLKDGRVCKPVPPLAIASPPSKSTVKKKPWKRCPNICKFFGTFDEFHLMTWKTAFDRKMELGDVGIGVKKSIDFRYLFKTDVPKDRDSKNQKMKGGSPPQVSGFQECDRSHTTNGDQQQHYFVRGRASRSSCPALSLPRNGFHRLDSRRKPIIPITCKQTSRVLNNSDVRVCVDIKTDEQPSPRPAPRLLPVDTSTRCRHAGPGPGRIISWPLVGGLVIRSQKTDDLPSSSGSESSVNLAQGANWMSLRTSSRHSTSSYGSNTSEEDIWVPRTKQ